MKTITDGIIATKDLELNINALPDADGNLADEQEIVDAVIGRLDGVAKEYESLLEPIWEELVHFDYMFRCGRNDTEKEKNVPMKTTEETGANVGATMFFRQIMQSAAKIYSFASARDAYWKYTPLETIGIPYSAEEVEVQSNMLNTLVKWNLKKDKFDSKLVQASQMVSKYGILFIGLDWIRKTSNRTIKFPAKDGSDEFQEVELDVIDENRASVVIHSPFSVLLDPNIDDIQRQDFVFITRTESIGTIIELVEQGYYSEEQFRKIGPENAWDGAAGRPKGDDINANRDVEVGANAKGSSVLVWDAWAMLPISESGELDETKHRPKRHRCTFAGNTIATSVCLRIDLNDHPEDRIPLAMIWDYPDDPDNIAHIGKGHVLKNNYAVETTTLNQMVDGVSVALNPPSVERKGAVIKHEGYGRGKRIVVRDNVNEDIREFNVNDRTQTGVALLGYTKEDSKTAVHTDNAQMGQGIGSRATATEASGVMQLSAAPSVMNAKYVIDQMFTFLSEEMKLFWQNYSIQKQVIQITDTEAPLQTIKPSEIYGEFDITVDIVDRVVDDILGEQKIAEDIVAFSTNQLTADRIEIEDLLNEYFIIRYGKSFVKNYNDADAIAMAHANIARIAAGDTALPPEEGQNTKAHLKIYRADRVRYRGVEEDFSTEVVALDKLIEQYALQDAGAQGGQAPQTGQQDPAGAGLSQTPSVAGAPDVALGGGANVLPTPAV